MPSPYSEDLRLKVMKHYEEYQSPTLTSRLFNISRSIIYDWKRLQDNQGNIQSKTNYRPGHSHKVTNMTEFKQIVDANPGATLQELVDKSGIKMSIMTCSRMLKKLNITRKKRRMGTVSAMSKPGKALLKQ